MTLGREHPGLELRVNELDPVAVPDALKAGTVDVALVHDYDFVPIEPDPGLDTEPLVEETMYLAAAAASRGGHGEAPHRGDPDSHPRGDVGGDTGADPVRRNRSVTWILGSPATTCHAMAVRTCQAAVFTPNGAPPRR